MSMMEMDDAILSNAVRTTDLHSDEIGQWVVLDDGPDHDGALLLPISWDHRQLLDRRTLASRFSALTLEPYELNAMRSAYEALSSLDEPARVRAMDWLAARLGIAPVEQKAPGAPRLPPAPAIGQEARREWLQQAWLADLSLQEIADSLGIKPQGVTSAVSRMRREGWDLPRRRRMPHGVLRTP